jgi:hypothetical protein
MNATRTNIRIYNPLKFELCQEHIAKRTVDLKSAIKYNYNYEEPIFN